MLSRPTDRTIIQKAWVVDDLEVAMRHWIEVLGVGPFFVNEFKTGPDGVLEDVTYRGQPAPLDLKVGISHAGPVQIELIETRTSGPTVYRDIVAPGRPGYHHFCVYTRDFEADRAFYGSKGIALATAGRIKGSGIRFGYYDTSAIYGCMIEVVDFDASVVQRYKTIAEAAANWDGRDPIRRNQ